MYKVVFEACLNAEYTWLQVDYCHHQKDLVDKFETSEKNESK